MILNLKDAPDDPVERIAWLAGVRKAVEAELDAEYQAAYYRARLQGQFLAALAVGGHGRERALGWTRRENRARGRMLRWGDGLDRRSSGYSPYSNS